MPATGKTVAAMPAGDVTFDRDKVAFGKSLHVVADLIDDADETRGRLSSVPGSFSGPSGQL